jgi:hypothetical protein
VALGLDPNPRKALEQVAVNPAERNVATIAQLRLRVEIVTFQL